MPYEYSDPTRANERHALPNVWITRRDRSDGPDENGDPTRAGWYYCYCQIGCLPDSDWTGPFRSYGAAVRDMRENDSDGCPLPEDGMVYQSSRPYGGRAMSPRCHVVDARVSCYSYLGKVRIDGVDMHRWRVRPARGFTIYGANGNAPIRPAFRPYYVFSLNVARV